MIFIKIGNVEIKKTAALAPMAGTADKAFRTICEHFGVAYTVGEMVSAKGLVQGSVKSGKLMEREFNNIPFAVQLFGAEPYSMQGAVEYCMEYKPDIIDINMGCPAPKIAGNGGGSALMKDIKLSEEIIKAVRKESPVPVTVKFRKGWDENNINAVEFAKMCEQAGADAVTIHGRTRKQMYAPPVDWDIIAKVKESVKIPVIGNGDVITPEDAKRMYEHTGCDLVMIGRGALGRPWIFSQVEDYLKNGSYLPNPPIEEQMAIMKEHIKLMIENKGEKIAFSEARKHCAWYIKGINGAAKLRAMCGSISSFEDIEILSEKVIELK